MDNEIIDSFLKTSANPSSYELLKFLVALVLSLLFSYILKYFYLNYWRSISDKENISSNFIMLSLIVTIIIAVVKSSLALSLGLVGALSIVRFRTPIRSPYELVLYFSLLTVGIAAKVDLSITIILIIILTIIPFLITLISNRIKFKKDLSKEKQQIFLNFSGKIESTQLQNLAEEKYIKTYTVEKKEGSFYHIKVFAFFNNLNEKNNFINKWEKSINSFDVSKE